MQSVSVATYQLSYYTNTSYGFSRTFPSIILIAQSGGPVSDARIFYQPAGSAGFLQTPPAPNLLAFFPREQLETHLSMCQSESPLFIQWELDPSSTTGDLSEFALVTGEEPFGEDLIDTSP